MSGTEIKVIEGIMFEGFQAGVEAAQRITSKGFELNEINKAALYAAFKAELSVKLQQRGLK